MQSALDHDVATLAQDLRLLRLAIDIQSRSGDAKKTWVHTGQPLIVHAGYVCRLIEERLDGVARDCVTQLMDAVTGILASHVAGGTVHFEAVDEARAKLASALKGRVEAWILRSLELG
jgi:hypothetical protein